MVKIAWKTINGYGPYAYLQESLKDHGKVKSKHLAYLGAAGTNGLVPGKMLTVEAVEDFPGGRVMVPSVGDDTLDALKPKPMAKVQLMHEKVGEGLSKQQVLELLNSQPGKTVTPKYPVLAPPVQKVAPKLPPAETIKNVAQGLLQEHMAKEGGLVAPKSPTSAPPVSPFPDLVKVPLEVDQVALDANGKPLITAKSIKKLEAEAANGDMNMLNLITHGLAYMQKTEAKKWAIVYAAQDLMHKHNLNQGSQEVVTVPPPPKGVAHPKPEDVASKTVPEKAVQLDKNPSGTAKGIPQISLNDISILESAANSDDAGLLAKMALSMASPGKDEATKLAFKKAGKQLLEKLYAHQGNPQTVDLDTLTVDSPVAPKSATQAAATPTDDKPIQLDIIPSGSESGLPLIPTTDVKTLEKMANEGDVVNLTKTVLDLAQKQQTKSDKAAVKKAGKELLKQLYAKQRAALATRVAPPEGVAPPAPADVVSQPAAPAAATPTPLTPAFGPADDKPIQLDEIPSDSATGLPLISTTNVKKLEKMANQGAALQLTSSVQALVKAQKTKADQAAVKKAGQELLDKLYAKQSTTPVSPIFAPPQGVASPTPEAMASKPAATVTAAPEPLTPTPAPTDEKPIQLDITTPDKPNTYLKVTKTNVKKLEKAANQGGVEKLYETIAALAHEQKNELKQYHVLQAGKQLLEKLYAKQGNPQTVYIDQLAAAGKVAPKSTGVVVTSDGSVKPLWVQVGPQAGSTPGGVFEDQDGVKHYIKCPPTMDHVHSELLAFDLYRAIGLNVPETDMTVHDGKWCLTSKIIDGLSEGGTNPKDLKGAQEGFVADAWLANWDSVGVGVTKYDNILGLDGEAYRIDAGGALSYSGLGAPKGDKFGDQVTELDALRDPKVNPVAATVFGDMTLEQIKASAEPVLALESGEIENIVKLYQGTGPHSQAMIDKLLARQKYIGEWLEKKELGQKLTSVLSQKASDKAPEEQPAPVTVAPNNVKVGDVPKDNKGKALITALNVKKLETAAKKGEPELQKTCDDIIAKMLSPAKKAAVQNVCADLKGQLQGVPMVEGDGGSGLSEAVAQVDAGKVKLPKQSTPTPKVVAQDVAAVKNENKDYNKDLEQVSGKKGSNDGGLFKDKKLDTLHYLKWPNGDVRAKVEGLTGMLYAHAQVPVPNIRVVDFQDKKAVMSDWIEDAQPMTVAQMKKHKDVLNGFVVDAWLANWDAVGLSADNIVKGPGNKAYRIDLGGSMLFRAQGKPKDFPAEVMELETMLDGSVNPQSASVFADISAEQLREGATRLEQVNDTLIDQAVDHANLPKTSADYPVSVYGEEAKDLPRFLKTRLKERRNHIVMEVLKKAEAQKVTSEELAQTSDLTPASINIIVDKTKGFKASTPSTQAKWGVLTTVMGNELGSKDKAKQPAEAVKNHYQHWKGTTTGPTGAALRWAAGELYGDGRREIERLAKYNQFLGNKSLTVSKAPQAKVKSYSDVKHVKQISGNAQGQHLVDGLKVANKHNSAVFRLQHPKKKTITLYRGWRPDQVKYLELSKLKVGDTAALDDPPLYSWSLYPGIGKSFGHGSIVTKTQVPIENVVLSDIVNSTGSYSNENEVLFKGLKETKIEVTQKA